MLALATGLPAAFIVAAGVALHFRVLGRHFTPLLPVVFLILAAGILAAWRRGPAGKLLVAVFFGLYLASALSLRLSARHEKDDYRAAANLAKAALATGKTVWWNATKHGAAYYHVPQADAAHPQAGVWVLLNPLPETLPATRPDLIIASREDVFDAYGAMARFLAQAHYHVATNLMAFTVWAPPAETALSATNRGK